jgi:RNA polymerase sigma-70 factor (ECF subfamily)
MEGWRMTGPPTTRLSLLVRLRDGGDAEAWADFVNLYAPLVYGLARRHGLQDADAADLSQDVLRALVGAVPQFRYDPARGKFRGWLFTVARNQLRKFLTARRRQPVGTGDRGACCLLRQQAAPEEVAAWEQEYQARLFELASQRVRDCFRPATWQAFWRSTVQGEEPSQVGAALGMSVGAVYIARTRVLARLREEVRLLEGEEPNHAQGGRA